MKSKYIKLLPVALCAAMLFSGCGAGQTAVASTPATATVLSQAVQNSKAATAGTADLAAEETTGAYDAAFSKRDLSGEYDASETIAIILNGNSANCDSEGVTVAGSTVTITAAGTYLLSGTLDGTIIVDATNEDKVQLVLDSVTIRSDTFAAIYVKQADKVFITLANGAVNTLSNGGAFTQIDDNNVDAAIFSKDDLTLNGTGTLKISSPAGHGIVSKDELTITDGSYEISASKHALSGKDSIAIADGTFTLTSGKDGLHSENSDDETYGSIYIAGGTFTISSADDGIHANTLLTIDGGTFDITAAEGLEATYIQINGGDTNIAASDDGINAARKSSVSIPTVEFNGGTVTITMGAGDTDGVDSNGNLIINGGAINVTGRSAFDYDGAAQYNGGTIIVNGQQVSSIPNQMMGGGFGKGGRNRG
ncbi:MAG: carbohydrate-binding domain-containing protein [Oscillospiraceae bacterium]|nr:carbohydrate-binding domain-containing protein [Oscillospiraceae bacterium]